MEVSFLLTGKRYLMHIQATFIWFITCHFFSHGEPYQPSLVYTSRCSYVQISGELLVLCSASSTMYSRPKMTDGCDDQRKRSKLPSKDLKFKQMCLYIFKRRYMETHIKLFKKNVIWEANRFELRTCFQKSKLHPWQQSFTRPETVSKILPGAAIRSKRTGPKACPKEHCTALRMLLLQCTATNLETKSRKRMLDSWIIHGK